VAAEVARGAERGARRAAAAAEERRAAAERCAVPPGGAWLRVDTSRAPK